MSENNAVLHRWVGGKVRTLAGERHRGVGEGGGARDVVFLLDGVVGAFVVARAPESVAAANVYVTAADCVL